MARASESIELSPRIERLCWTVFAAVLMCGLLLYSAVVGVVRNASQPTAPQTIVVLMSTGAGETGAYPVQLPAAETAQDGEVSDVAAN